MADPRLLRSPGQVLGLFGFFAGREVLEEVRHAIGAVRALESRRQCVFVVEVGSDDLGTAVSQSLGGGRRRVARQGAAGELAARVVEDRAGQPAALCTRRTYDRDQLLVRHRSPFR